MKNYLSLLLVCLVGLSACSSSDNSDDAFSDSSVATESGSDPVAGGADSDPVAGDTSDTSDTAEPTAPTSDTTPPASPAPTPDSPTDATGDSSETPAEPASMPAPETSESSADSLSPEEPTSPRPDPIEPIQPGTLTAGDYDDQLNPWLYEQYSDNYLQNVRPQENIPRLNLSRRIELSVRDDSDRPYAGANVALLDAQGNTISKLVTATNGITYLYEDLDGLGDEFVLKIDDRLGDVSMTQTIQLSSIGEQRQLEFRLDTPNVAPSQLDLQLVLDTTGSMGDELSYLQTELTSILNNVQNAHPQLSIRTGLVVYRDIGDQYVVRSYPFTDNLSDMQSALNGETFGGGGDYPEAMDQALAEALSFDWREQSVKVSLLVADAPPHLENVGATWASAMAARSQQIHLVPLAASGVAEDAEYLMRSMAALTNSRYLFLTDDSGLGNAHNEPTVDCYIVTRLDGLMERVFNQYITGERTEPSSNEVIREVGDYDEGVCNSDQQ